MDNILKQRLVGALILVALGVVFWPIIFVEPTPEVGSDDVRIPPRPLVDDSPIEPPDTVGLRPSPELDARSELRESDVDVAAPIVLPVPGERDGPDEAGQGDSPEPVASPGQADPEPAPAMPQARDTAPVSPELDAQGVPVAWILQVATLGSEENAEKLRKRLLEMDEKAYIKKIRRDDRNLYRVYIGPGFEKARIEALKPRVDEAIGVQSVVQRYLP